MKNVKKKIYSRNGVFGLDIAKSVIITFLILAVTGIAIILSVTSLSGVFEEEDRFSYHSSTQNETYTSQLNIIPIYQGITSLSSKRYNNTWLDFDGVDDYASIEYNGDNSITFWYNSSTSEDWVFIINSSSVYVDGLEDTPVEYPIYYNGTHYLLGKTDDTTFWAGSIDDFRIVNYTIDENLSMLMYNGGRL